MTYPLQSPGVSVSIIDESPYASAGRGTIPLILFATHEYKSHSSGNGIAQGSLPENANKLYYISSQRELIQTFGNPIFYSSGGTPLHGYELNEYGLHAAYSYLAMASSCFVIRAPIDLGQLLPRSTSPRGDAADGTYWLDTGASNWGVFESNGNAVSGRAWNARQVIRVETDSDIESALIGTVGFTNVSDVAVVNGGVLVINGHSISISNNTTLQGVIDAINLANTTITAVAFRINGRTRLLLRNTQAGESVIIDSGTTIDTNALGINGVQPYFAPKSTIGNDGQFAIVLKYNDNILYQKLKPEGLFDITDNLSLSFWFPVGGEYWGRARPTRSIGLATPGSIVSGDSFSISDGTDTVTVTISGTSVDSVVSSINNAMAALPASSTIKEVVASKPGTALIITNPKGRGLTLTNVNGSPLNALGNQSRSGNRMFYSPHYQVPAGSMSGDVWVKTTRFNSGAEWIVKQFDANTGIWKNLNPPLYANDADANVFFGSRREPGVVYVQFNLYGTTNNPIGSHRVMVWTGVSWEPTPYEASRTEPTSDPDEDTLWYSTQLKADIMISTGQKWVGYANYPGFSNTDPAGVIFSASTPKRQSTGAPLVDNDLWVDTRDTENFPKLMRYNTSIRDWEKIDTTDQTTPFGIIFSDARNSANGLNDGSTDQVDLRSSNFVDPDAPDPQLHPDGMLLWNTRISTYNVKQWKSNYFREGDTDYLVDGYSVGTSHFPPLTDVGRWVNASGNQTDGRPYSGRKAQRNMVVKALSGACVSNDDARSETVSFNLMAAPGYVELIDEMIDLNTQKFEMAFIVADPPCRLAPNGTDILKWANPDLSGSAGNTEAGLGQSSNNPYVGVWYPWGLSTNIDGQEIMIPSSTIALRILAYSDMKSYPWFAPAGFTRGLVTNASTVGYLTPEGEFMVVLLSPGQRDLLYQNKINPLAYIPNRGLVAYGQKTRHAVETSLDRINVARLINYMRFRLDVMVKPFLFEPNDAATRDGVRSVLERFLADLVGLRGLYDFIVVCDETNNSPERIDRSELWADIAIQPVKALEFIYIPLRIMSTGTDMRAALTAKTNFS